MNDDRVNYILQLLNNPGSWNTEIIQGARAEYGDMLKRLGFLDALEAAGVDNWEGYSDAWAIYEQYYADEETPQPEESKKKTRRSRK